MRAHTQTSAGPTATLDCVGETRPSHLILINCTPLLAGLEGQCSQASAGQPTAAGTPARGTAAQPPARRQRAGLCAAVHVLPSPPLLVAPAARASSLATRWQPPGPRDHLIKHQSNRPGSRAPSNIPSPLPQPTACTWLVAARAMRLLPSPAPVHPPPFLPDSVPSPLRSHQKGASHRPAALRLHKPCTTSRPQALIAAPGQHQGTSPNVHYALLQAHRIKRLHPEAIARAA
jgi:hypothetical protein